MKLYLFLKAKSQAKTYQGIFTLQETLQIPNALGGKFSH